MFSTGKNIKQSEASPEFATPCVRYGELYHMYGEVITKIINRTNIEKSELKFSDGDEILLPSAGEDPLDIGSASALTVKNIAIGRTINILKPKKSGVYDQKFASYYINQKLRRKISTLARGASISNVYNSDLRKLEIALPSLPEQQKIADFLTAVDERIQQLIRKKALLEEYKKGVMQQLFSQTIRFKDDGGNDFPDWEEKKLGEVVEIKSGLSLDQNSGAVGFKVTRIETISDRAINLDKVGYVATEKNIEDFRLLPGDILFSNINSVSHIGKVAFVDRDYDLYQGMNLLRLRPNQESDPRFVFQLLSSVPFVRYFQRICNQAVSQASINQTDLKKTPLKNPYFDEQTKIADFLSAIDIKIETVATQITETQTFKRGLLQQMFV